MAGDGEAIAGEVATVVDVVDDDATEVELTPVAPAAGVVGALTANWVPVTTVTCAPSTTWLGSSAITTAPVNERATASAAASLAGVGAR